ncbi:hypothetical protein BG844_14140 [Couchioplanes caeruleus subsp. caeruleus]|uniref:Uncharacterized protein n=1 Tax=Couchioplanes caeruleus subsp. caeruleus TaxID=56427 RepID=A0A1K0GR43_9ACTN|nr:hypothetical protein BG844_14140 [Couchioplanes caeruleus subsp. caeruleus]
MGKEIRGYRGAGQPVGQCIHKDRGEVIGHFADGGDGVCANVVVIGGHMRPHVNRSLEARASQPPNCGTPHLDREPFVSNDVPQLLGRGRMLGLAEHEDGLHRHPIPAYEG